MQGFWQTVAGRTAIGWLKPVVFIGVILACGGMITMLLNLHEIGLVVWKVKP